jgi:hypothetical protein
VSGLAFVQSTPGWHGGLQATVSSPHNCCLLGAWQQIHTMCRPRTTSRAVEAKAALWPCSSRCCQSRRFPLSEPFERAANINAHLSAHHLLALARPQFKAHIDLTKQRLARLAKEQLEMPPSSHELNEALRSKKGYEQEIASARTLLQSLSPGAKIHFNFEEGKVPRLMLRIEMPTKG